MRERDERMSPEERMLGWLEAMIEAGVVKEGMIGKRKELVERFTSYPEATLSRVMFSLGVVAYVFPRIDTGVWEKFCSKERGALKEMVINYFLLFPEGDSALLQIEPLGSLTLTPSVLEKATGGFDESLIKRWKAMGVLTELDSLASVDPAEAPEGPYLQIDSGVREVIKEVNRFLDPMGTGARAILNQVVYG